MEGQNGYLPDHNDTQQNVVCEGDCGVCGNCGNCAEGTCSFVPEWKNTAVSGSGSHATGLFSGNRIWLYGFHQNRHNPAV